jgi:hypothetical protein
MRLVIHAGFAKCGSSAIQHALEDYAPALKRQSIFLFGKDLHLNDRFRFDRAPFWTAAKFFLDPARRNETRARISGELKRVGLKHPDATAVVSAEVLTAPGSERLFEGLDSAFEIRVVFYIRPQFEWIPSAWKQWSLPKGISLETYVAACLARNIPPFRRTLDAWSHALPGAAIDVRILPQAIADSGSPAGDFFRLIGATVEPVPSDAQSNPSLDFSVLHVLNRNPGLFEGRKGHKVFNALAELLSEQHLKTNVRMLSPAEERRIAGHFRHENMHILRNYLHLAEVDAARAYAEHFQPSGGGRSYAEIAEIDVLRRCLGILLEALIREREARRPIVRWPYWKISSRLAKRLRGQD